MKQFATAGVGDVYLNGGVSSVKSTLLVLRRNYRSSEKLLFQVECCIFFKGNTSKCFQVPTDVCVCVDSRTLLRDGDAQCYSSSAVFFGTGNVESTSPTVLRLQVSSWVQPRYLG